jgi:hypothetical protein
VAFRNAVHGTTAVRDRVADVSSLTTAAFDATSSSNNPQGPLYGSLLTVLFGLCIIWALRQVLAGRSVRIRDALYNGPASLLSVVTILAVIFLQLLPLTFGAFMYTAGVATGIASNGLQHAALFVGASLLALLSCYWLSTSLIALMAASLPGMYPIAALKAAKELVGPRRWQLFQRILVFALLMALAWLVIIVAVVSNRVTIIFTTEVLDILRTLTLLASVVYLYKLYRSLVDETA